MIEHSNKLNLTIKNKYAPIIEEKKTLIPSALKLGVMEFICVLFVTLGCILCLLDIFRPASDLNFNVFNYCILWSVFFTILFHLSKPKISAIVSLCLFALYVYWNHELLIIGCKYFINLIIKGINPYYFVDIPLFPNHPLSINGFELLLGCIIFTLTLLFTYTLILHKKISFLVTITIFILLFGLMLGLLPVRNNLFLLLISLFFTIPLGSKKNSYGKDKSSVFFICCQVCILLSLLCLLAAQKISEKTAPSILQHHKTLLNAEKAVESSIISGSWYYDLFLSGAVPFLSSKPGALNNNQPIFSEIPILEITTDTLPSQSFYLKDWVGGNYGNNSWLPISEEKFVNASKTFPLNASEDAARSIHDLSYKHFQAIDPGVAYNADEIQESIMTISKLQKTMSGFPSPYYCKIPEEAVPIADGYYTSDIPFEKVVYQGYPAKNGFPIDILLELKVDPSSSVYMPATDYLMNSIENNPISSWEINSSSSLAKLPNFINDTDIALEKAYRNYAYKEYTTVPAKGLNRIKALCEEMKSELTNTNSMYYTSRVINFVTSYLSNNAAYNTKLNDLPSDAEIVENFLFEEKQGFCIHFASAATLMFRMFGIPARYATGYLIPASSFKIQKNEQLTYTAIIKDSAAHAWPEIYLDGIGWVPIESTPGSSLPIAERPLASIEPSNQTPLPDILDSTPGNTPEATKVPPIKDEVTPSPNNTTNNKNQSSKQTTSETYILKIPIWVFNILCCFLICIIIFVVLIIRRTIIIKKRIVSMHQNDTKKAVESICFEVFRLIKFEKYMRNDFENDAEFANFIQKYFTCFGKKEFTTFASICEKAIFSKNGIDDDELSYCQNIYSKLLTYETEKFTQKKNIFYNLYVKYIVIP